MIKFVMIILAYLSINPNNKLTKQCDCSNLFNEETKCSCDNCNNLFKLPKE